MQANSQLMTRMALIKTLLLALLMLLPALARAVVGTGLSPLFNVDTRWGGGTSAAVSGFFTVDTRFSGSTGEGVSGWFTVDTRGVNTGTAVIDGFVGDTSGAALAGATVSALQNGVIRAQTTADAWGNYALTSLADGAYDVRADLANYLTGIRYGVNAAAGQSTWQSFALSGKPAPPVVVATNRAYAPVVVAVISSPQLLTYDPGQGAFVTNALFDSSKMTVVLTHGWNSDPTVWAASMAAQMIASGVTNANLLAWDWRTAADTGLNLSAATTATPREGEKLGQALAQTFDATLGTYHQPVHFIGHSLGTMVNAEAANYLEEQTGGTYAWLTNETQMTLMDDAESAMWVAPSDWLNWISPIPHHYVWIDNYISFVGRYHPEAVNVLLEKSALFVDMSSPIKMLQSLHGYAWGWYGRTVLTPALSILGSRYSYERFAGAAQFPGYAPGSLFQQDASASSELTLDQLPATNQLAAAAAVFPLVGLPPLAVSLLNYVYNTSLNYASGEVQTFGLAAVDETESWFAMPSGTAVSTGTAGSTPAYYANTAPPQAIPAWSYLINLQTQPGTGALLANSAKGIPTPRAGEPGGSNSAACVWIPVQIPTNAALFAFDFTFNGDPEQDFLSASIAGTNIFALETRFIPTNSVLNSGPIDVSQWAGQTVELFFGVVGGTSTNANVTLSGMRFYAVAAPVLTAQPVENGVVIQWPLSADGYTLESADSLESAWMPVTNTPVIVGFENTITNDVSAGSRFYRLRKP